MPEISIPLIKGDRQSKLDYRDNLPVNMTAVIRSIKGDDGYLLTHDGLTSFAETNGVARGGTYNERFRKHFRVSGGLLESINTDGSIDVIGDIAGSAICSFANSFNTQAVLSNGRMWLYDDTTLTEILDNDLGTPIDIDWFKGIYVLTDGESLYQTDISDEYKISPLKFTSSEFAADPIKGVARNDQNQILAFNRYSIEYFGFNPSADINATVLQNIQGKAIKLGILGTHCKVEMNGVFFILGGRREESPSVYALAGGQAVPVATREIDKLIAKYTEDELADVVMEARVKDGDQFLIVHLPCETLIYNHSVGSKYGKDVAWSYVKTGVNTDGVWRGKFGVFDPRVSKWIYGDLLENKLGYLNDEIASQYDENVEVICYTPIVPLKTRSILQFEIDTIPGFQSDIQSASFSMSYNGVTYGKEYFNSISVSDDYNKRYISRPLAYIRDSFSMKFRVVSKDKVAFSGLVIEHD
tara:strand:+ start:812 stop:2221 length:1410 start_codon:yes stop_codon:yes gene_type:complete